MSRNRVNDRAELIYEYLRDRLNEPQHRHEMLEALSITDSSTTRSALRRARELAEADDLCLPVPCQANGFTLTVSDDPVSALDPALWLARTEQGVRATKDVHEAFMRSRMEKMPKEERAVTTAFLDFEDRVAEVNAGAASLTQAIMSMRKAGRDDDEANA